MEADGFGTELGLVSLLTNCGFELLEFYVEPQRLLRKYRHRDSKHYPRVLRSTDDDHDYDGSYYDNNDHSACLDTSNNAATTRDGFSDKCRPNSARLSRLPVVLSKWLD